LLWRIPDAFFPQFCKTERWNYFKGDYTNMNTFLQCDWNDILKRKNAGQQFDIFMTKFNEAKNK
jgi:hypothetical protein